jgi:hypothetical protein
MPTGWLSGGKRLQAAMSNKSKVLRVLRVL